MTTSVLRDLTIKETKILEKMTSIPFLGRNKIRKQMTSCKVKDIYDKDGNYWGIEFKVDSDIIAKTNKRVPVLCRVLKDRIPIEILLHIVEGKIYELEIVRYDSKPVEQFPDPEELEVYIN